MGHELDAALLVDGSDGAARRAATEIARAALEASSAETAEHSDDVVTISEALCDRLGVYGPERDDIVIAARLHDIGKVAVPRDILEKPGTLNPDEWSVIRRHTVVGEQILRAVPEMEGAATLVRHSHERWDGGGYPDGLGGDGIPLGSRIIFCADAFHAIRCDRPYRHGIPAPDALAEIVDCSATQFDPDVVGALEQTARELNRAAAPRRMGRSNRLVALLLVVALGVAGSAVARSGLWPTPKASANPPANGATVGGGTAAAVVPCGLASCATGAHGIQLVGTPLSAYGVGSSLEPAAGRPGAPGLPFGTAVGGNRGVRDHGQGIGRGNGNGKGQGKGPGNGKAKGHTKTLGKGHGKGKALGHTSPPGSHGGGNGGGSGLHLGNGGGQGGSHGGAPQAPPPPPPVSTPPGNSGGGNAGGNGNGGANGNAGGNGNGNGNANGHSK